MVSKQQFFSRTNEVPLQAHIRTKPVAISALYLFLPLNNKSFRENGSKCETEDTTSWAPQAMIGYLDTRRSRCQSPEDH